MRKSADSTGRWRGLVAMIAMAAAVTTAVAARAEIPLGRAAPELSSGAWINSEPLTMRGLRGRVVLVDFWTFG